MIFSIFFFFPSQHHDGHKNNIQNNFQLKEIHKIYQKQFNVANKCKDLLNKDTIII